jgi:peptidoglycan hydrolase-like protein with peptidoglycan-binding domain
MTTGEVRFASLAFVAMTLTVAINLFVMQGERAGLSPAAARLAAESPVAPPATGLVDATALGPKIAPDTAPLKIEPPQATGALPPVSSAELIRGIQRELNARGYDAGPPDGVAGQVTQAAIMAYEFDSGLPLTAAPSQELLSRIILGSSAPQLGQAGRGRQSISPEASNLVRNVQTQLRARGYPVGQIDGIPGDQLAQAIRAFEIDQRLKETGRVSGPLVSRLVRLQVEAPR